MFGNEFLGKNVLHVASVEQGVGYVVGCRIDFRILDGIFYVFNAYDFLGISGHEVGNSARSRVYRS